MNYPHVHRKVDGYECPKHFNTEYDLTTKNCEDCGQPKHYKPCNYIDAQACYGWGDPLMGPLSCKGYVKLCKDSKPKLIKCNTCLFEINDSYVIKKGDLFECYDCDDPNWMRDLPTMESRGAI